MSKLDHEYEIKRLWIELSKMEGRVRKNAEEYTDLAIAKFWEKIQEWVAEGFAIKIVQTIVFGGVATILIAVLGALISLIIIRR